MAAGSIIIGGGCFWCLESVYLLIKDVRHVTSGYCGGNAEHPTYQAVCSGTTGHAEVIKVEFDNSIINLREILTIFWTIHNPTTPNQQGADIGPQYRSIVFYDSPEMQKEIITIRDEMQRYWDDPIVTEIVPSATFWPAEEYHQNYFAKNPENAYCQVTINPKLAKLKKQFSDYLKTGIY